MKWLGSSYCRLRATYHQCGMQHPQGLELGSGPIFEKWPARGGLESTPSGGVTALGQVRESTGGPVCISREHLFPQLVLVALSHDWPAMPLYTFPSFPLITATLDRVILIGHQLLLIAPCWPRPPWFSLLLSLLSGPHGSYP